MMAKIWAFVAKIWRFFAKTDTFEGFFAFNFQALLSIFLIFGMEVVLMVLFQKIILYMLEKFWYGEIWSI